MDLRPIHWALVGLTILLLVGAGYSLGRYAAPARVVEKVRTVEVEKVVTKEVVKVERVEAKARTVFVHEHKTIKPDGTTVVDRTEREHENTKTETAAAVVTEKTEARESTKLKDVEVRSRSPPDWHLSFLAGLRAGSVLQGQLSPVYGAHVQRRLIGPFSVGAWGLSTGAAGVSLSLEF
jgi:hypothetical protein